MTNRTIQLRRYQIAPGELERFSELFANNLVPARTAFGFTAEFAYAVPETGEFVWAVSHEGDEAAFSEAESTYYNSPERAAASEGIAERVQSAVVHFVTTAV